ncbi:FecR domain-containing protein [Chitinophaga sp.]|uniref:FecR family protein n=1 Tax=Chitinophaga sp. TaxID=1869181 RepID=UPI0031DBCD84
MDELLEDIPLMRHMMGEENESIDLALRCNEKFRQHYETLRARWEASGLLGAVAAIDVDRQWEQFKRRREKRVWPLVIKVAAAVAGVAVLAALLWRQPVKQPLIHLVTPPGQKKTITLPDSTKVWLNAGSELVYDPGERAAILKGEAYFEVQADPEHPFFVEAGHVKVEVLGTRFNLMAYEGDSLVSTSLLQGRVRLHSGEDTLTVKPGERAVWHGNEAVFRTEGTGTETDTRWKEGELVFRKEPVERAFATIERWFGAKVVYTRGSLAGHVITARLEKGETLERTFMLLREILPMQYEISNNVVYVRHQ